MKPYEQMAVRFAEALVDEDFEAAHALLAPALAAELSVDDLCEQLHALLDLYDDAEAERAHFDPRFSYEDWPAKEPGDVGSAYVAIEGEGFAEAVDVVVASLGGELRIRTIEWGRP